eukprot:TRINITY_DN14887_c0_g1_i1.p1 TRINITY_DN14887_c0_g1~~TRINITY_DN14887_c0_g1_i1.p1  ORF type:complete len:105 (+),score=9.20 TRINITY_DN14887_c0_g1_i1:71-385(+)
MFGQPNGDAHLTHFPFARSLREEGDQGFQKAIGILILVLGILGLISVGGCIAVGKAPRRNCSIVRRDEEPNFFWLTVGIHGISAVGAIIVSILRLFGTFDKLRK